MKTLKQYKNYSLLALNGLALVFSCTSFNATATMPKCHPPGAEDPLIVDLGGDGVHLGAKDVAVLFDLQGNGMPRAMQWTAPYGNEAFLAMDKNDNGIVDDGSELFTNYNLLLLENIPAPNGFADLAQYDHPDLGGNDDGFITDADQVWTQLRLWLDTNADGISTVSEMHLPADVNLTRFDIVPKINNRKDEAGNVLPLWSWATDLANNANKKYKMIDVFFKPVL